MFLSFLIFLPLIFAFILGGVPKKKLLFPLALSFSLLEFLCSLFLFLKFDSSTAALQFVERIHWIPSIGISYFLGLDGLSFWLVLLTTFLIPFAILSSRRSIQGNQKGFFISLFILESTVLGTFLSMDVVLFYIFFEMSLIPMYFIIGLWGGPRRVFASIKFFIYTMSGSILMLLALITLIFMTRSLPGGEISASLLDFYKLKLPFVAGEFFTTSSLLFFAFSLAFVIKIPLFPFHTWLPEAHVEAPTAGSVVLAGVLLKVGAYGFLRFVLPLFPQAVEHWSWLFLLLSTLGILYGALLAMAQSDMKKLVAYSSVSHMGYVMLGVFSYNMAGFSGSLFQMLSHGISTGALFLLVGMIYERTHMRDISAYGGLASKAPLFSIFFILVSLSSIALPLTNGFVGEFLILLGTFTSPGQRPYAFVAVLGVILGASYMLWMIHRVFFGTLGAKLRSKVEKESLSLDINLREKITLIPFAVLIFWMGIFPNHFLSWMRPSLKHLIQNRYNYQLSVLDSSSSSKKGEEKKENHFVVSKIHSKGDFKEDARHHKRSFP